MTRYDGSTDGLTVVHRNSNGRILQDAIVMDNLFLHDINARVVERNSPLYHYYSSLVRNYRLLAPNPLRLHYPATGVIPKSFFDRLIQAHLHVTLQMQARLSREQRKAFVTIDNAFCNECSDSSGNLLRLGCKSSKTINIFIVFVYLQHIDVFYLFNIFY